MKWTVGAKIGTGFGLALIIQVTVGIVSHHSTQKLVEAADWEAHTHQVLESLGTFASALVDAETGQRGYIITSDESYLEPYHAGVARVDRALEEIRKLTQDDPQQQRRLDTLEPLIRQRLTRLRDGIEVQKTKGPEGGRQWILSGKGKGIMDEVRDVIAEIETDARALLKMRSEEANATANAAEMTIIAGTIVALIVVLSAGVLIARNISGRLREITQVAKKAAEGNLTGSELTTCARDEVGELADAFNTMRSNLREMTAQIRDATDNVTSATAEMVASTKQQATAAKEQAATIQEISSTLKEITESGGQIEERARRVAGEAEAASTASSAGADAAQEVTVTVEGIRDQVEQVAENIVSLSGRTQAIAELIATVTDIAEQSNLLALNASIEAVSAGEQGSRFSVVANEMKNLADQAKNCTVQVRTILGEIQKGIHSSVMLTEEAVKRVEKGKTKTEAAEGTIRQMADTTVSCVQAFQQIVGGTNQQQIGVSQVTKGMEGIRQAVDQTAIGTSQLEKAASSLSALSHQLQNAVRRYQL